MRMDDFKLFLMADDNDDERFLTQAIFQVAYPGIRFRGEKDPLQLVAYLNRSITSGVRAAEVCVLVDIHMPRVNGFELIYRLRNEIGTHECCILMLSGSRIPDDRDHALEIGADGFVNKPFKIANLERALANCRGVTRAA